MINYSWSILEIFASNNQLSAAKYLLVGTDGTKNVGSEGTHIFKDGTVKKSLSEIVEADIVQWIEQDITVDDINPIKLSIENQINNLETTKKVDFPWLAGTFTIG